MFLWLELLGLEHHTEELVSKAFLMHKVVALPGSLFEVKRDHSDSNLPCPFVRVSFGGLDEDKIRHGFERIGEALRDLKRKVTD